MPKKGEKQVDPATLPSTLQRSDPKAQRTYAETLASAEQTYDDEGAAHRVAFAALKHTHEKVGDHWEPKEHNGPSDAQAAGGVDTTGPRRAEWTRTPPRSTCSASPGGSASLAGRG
jgi:cation transport regulator ChaB